MITGCGDAVEGTFSHGDVLFLDAGVKKVKLDAVYAFHLAGGLYIKRLQQRPGGSVLMISDNPKYQAYSIEEKFQVIARVVGMWNFRRI